MNRPRWRSGGLTCLDLLVALLCAVLLGCSHPPASTTSPSGAAPNAATASDGSPLFDVLLARNGQSAKIGRVAADTSYHLRVVSAEPGQKQFLTETVELMNGKEVLHAEAPATPGAPKFAEASRSVPRSSPEFLAQLQVHLKQYYDLTLKPVSK